VVLVTSLIFFVLSYGNSNKDSFWELTVGVGVGVGEGFNGTCNGTGINKKGFFSISSS
jgi:hypothetical protein